MLVKTEVEGTYEKNGIEVERTKGAIAPERIYSEGYLFTQRNRPVRLAEITTGEKLVETAGYVPMKRRVQNLLQAGTNLLEFRKNYYDSEMFESGEIPKNYDPTVLRGSPDPTEVEKVVMSVDLKLAEAQEAIDAAKNIEKEVSADVVKNTAGDDADNINVT